MIEPIDTLIVPITLTALAVGQTDVNGSDSNPYGTKDFARLTPDFSLLPYAADGIAHNPGPYLSTQALPHAFQGASDPLGVGIHLHWELPEALTHGSQAKDGGIDFPAAPNRWVILRIARNQDAPATQAPTLRAWVLESDRLWDADETNAADVPAQNAVSLDVPIRSDPGTQPNKSWLRLGRVFDYEDWSEADSAQRTHLTALGYGEATYAATYQLCRNVFGFWDTLSDLAAPGKSMISYLVMGWHSGTSDDPLVRIDYPSGATHQQKLAAIAAEYGWSVPADADAPVPSRTVYSAATTGIPWNPETHYLNRRKPKPGGVSITVGDTTTEALSALLASKPGLADDPSLELVLNALQLGLLSRLGLPGGLRDIDEALQKDRFAAVEGGSTWIVEPTAGAGSHLRDLPVGFGADLDALNRFQSDLDRLEQDVAGLRARIFADWVRYMQIQYGPPDEGTQVPPDAARGFLEAEVKELNALLARRDTAQQSVDAARKDLEVKLGDSHVLSTTTGPRFWNPTDPALLFSGDDIASSRRRRTGRTTGEDGLVACRLGNRTLTTMETATKAASLTIHTNQLPTLAPKPALPTASVLAVLVGETLFLDPSQAPLLASVVAGLGGEDNPAQDDFSGFCRQVVSAQEAVFGDDEPGPVAFTGTPPPRSGIAAWSAPWNPIILQWEVEHFPNALPPYQADFIVDNYSFDEGGLELQFNGSVPVDPQLARTYSGTIVLANDTEVNIREQIESYLANFPDDDVDGELRDLLDRMRLPAQAQALSGFNQHLLMLARILQMQVSDPLGLLQGLFFANFTNVTIRNAVAEANVDSPLVNNTFSPLRNGGFRVTRVRIIDAFGQPLDMPLPRVTRAANLIPPVASEELINLPIRIVQPARLAFEWLPCTGNLLAVNSHPTTTPVFGWVLFNRLDRALMIYDESGVALGSLNLLGPLWQGAPGNQETYGKPIAEAFATANPHLRAFALGVGSAPDPAAYLADILRAIDASMGFIVPTQEDLFDNLSVLIGRPIALTRAILDIELQGLPAMDQSMAAFEAAVRAGDAQTREGGNATNVRVPVVLGDPGDIDDGLIGYFIEGPEPASYHTFYCSAADGSGQGVVDPAFDQITVNAARLDPAVTVVMLVDPNAPIHARTGLLPVEELQIPSDMTADELARISATFLTAPILLSDEPRIPVPPEPGRLWNWVTMPAGSGEWSIVDVNQESDASLVQHQAREGWLKLVQAPASDDADVRARKETP